MELWYHLVLLRKSSNCWMRPFPHRSPAGFAVGKACRDRTWRLGVTTGSENISSASSCWPRWLGMSISQPDWNRSNSPSCREASVATQPGLHAGCHLWGLGHQDAPHKRPQEMRWGFAASLPQDPALMPISPLFYSLGRTKGLFKHRGSPAVEGAEPAPGPAGIRPAAPALTKYGGLPRSPLPSLNMAASSATQQLGRK